MPVRTAKKAAPAARSTRPATKKPAVSAPAPEKAVSAGRTRKPSEATAEKAVESPKPVVGTLRVTAHDVLRAELTFENAKKAFEQLRAEYWAQYDVDVDEIKELSQAAIHEFDGPEQQGRPPADGPMRKARVRGVEPVIGEAYDRTKVSSMGLVELRKLAKELVGEGLITELKVKSEILKQMEEAGLFRSAVDASADEGDAGAEPSDAEEDEEGEDEEGEYEDDDDEDDGEEDDEGDSISAADLREMTLKDLQDVAEENGVKWKGKKQAALLEELLALVEDDEEEADEPDDEEDDDEEEDGGLTEESIRAMSLKELQKLAAQLDTAPPLKVKKDRDALVEWLLENLEEEE